jgi:hypothetical protein
LVLRTLVIVFCLLGSSAASAGPEATGDALDRLEEVLDLRINEGVLAPSDVMPAILVSAEPRYEVSDKWFATRAIEVLTRAFGDSGLRLCEACMAPRAYVEDGNLTYQTGPVSLDEIVRLDEQNRGPAQPAKTAIWLDEHRGGVSIRIVDLRTGRVVFAQNVDPYLVENANSERMGTLTEELERRARGDSLTQAFVDFAVYPGQHISVDITDQWGKTNANMSGITLSVLDPVLGVGICHYRRLNFLNVLVGAQGIISLPTAVASSLSQDNVDVIDPIVTAVGVVRVPFGRSNYGVVATGSTNGQIGVGLSLMNIRLLPVIP